MKRQAHQRIPTSAYILAHWRLYVWSYTFSAIVIALQLMSGIWQCYKYATSQPVIAAFGYGPAVAKFATGALYPTFFFMVLSMSRWLATIARHFGFARFVNWDRYRFFHIRMAVTALILSMLHTCGHVFGTFPTALKEEHRAAAEQLLAGKMHGLSWTTFIISRPGWTGLGALVLFLLVAALSTPAARRRSFEAFQVAHLLIFPILGLLALHGTGAFLQPPAMGYVLALPGAAVLFEKLSRVYQMSSHQIARISPRPGNCVEVSIFPRRQKRLRFYRPGQYILVLVPTLSRFQWHPFTVISATTKELVVIAKDNGFWTKKLQGQPEFVTVNLDGPFGAPNQNFWHYDNNILIGMGTGLTPSAAILNDLTTSPPHQWLRESCIAPSDPPEEVAVRKRLLILWIVRDSRLLEAFDFLFASMKTLQYHGSVHFEFHLYISRTQEIDKATFGRYNIEGMNVHLGKRPVFADVFDDYHSDFTNQLRADVLSTCQPRWNRPQVGVFFCGGAAAKSELRDICFNRTLSGILDGSEIQYHFHPEVF